MKIPTITSKPKEKVLDAVKRAVNNSSLMNKITLLNYKGIECLVYPNESGQGAISYIAKFNNILKKFKL